MRKKREFPLNAYIFKSLRRIFAWYPARKEVREEADNLKIGLYLCAVCGSHFAKNQVAVDHIQPVIDPKLGFQGWDVYVHRLFCLKENLQLVCKGCHKKKTNKENALRRKCKNGKQR